MKLLGEVVSWEAPKRVPVDAFCKAMAAAGLDKYVTPLRPRTAFSRAARAFARGRLVKAIRPQEGKPRYQFTRESATADGYLAYEKETGVVFDPATGAVLCPEKPDLAAAVELAVEEKAKAYEGGDVSGALQRAFEAEADLFQLRARSPFYLVPAQYAGLVETVAGVVEEIGGAMIRLPVPETPTGARAVRDAIALGISETAGRLADEVERFAVDTSPGAIERAAERIKGLRLKAEGYADLLSDMKDRVDEQLRATQEVLREKLLGLAREREAMADAIGEPAPEPAGA